MGKFRRKPFVIAMGALFMVLTGNQGIACGPDSESEPLDGTVPLSSLSIKTPVFMFDARGLLKGNLATGDWQQISNHGFYATPQIVPSADRRWISYGQVLKGMRTEQFWLFDTRTGRDRLYHQHPAWDFTFPEFSPDGKSITFFANYDRRWPSKDGAGLYLVDTETAQTAFLGNPVKIETPSDSSYASVTWLADGKELVLFVADVGYFSYRLAEKRYERIDGKYVLHIDGRYGMPGETYSRDGAALPVYEQQIIQSSAGFQTLASQDGRWNASIDKSYVLTVNSKDGPRAKVAVGGPDYCTVTNIRINGWLGGQYLVYTLRGTTYVYDAISGRNAVMFSSQHAPYAFFW